MGMTENQNAPDISVIIPVYNEEGNLDALRAELWPVLEGLGESFEVLFVDDGSTDGSPVILRRFAEEDPRIRVIRFARNFGQQMANTAGLRHARGCAVIIMDADLQTPAEHIPELLAKLREGYDIVYGRRERTHDPLYRRWGSRAAGFLINKTTGFRIPDSASGFVALDERLVKTVNRYNDRSRYLSGLFAWLSYGRYASIPVKRRPRFHGESKYNVFQLIKIVLNLITTWSNRPLQLVFVAGVVYTAIGLLIGLRWLQLLFTSGWAAAEPALFTLILVSLGCTILLGLGILGEYVGRIYGEVRQHPPYIIADIYGADERDYP